MAKRRDIDGRGCTDVPASVDKFNISKYIDGLTKFISKCDTPMTVAIQGDWGTGKTSIMNLVYKELCKSIDEENLIWFNTWQFSQFDLGDKLPMLLVSKLITQLGGKDQESVKATVKSIMSGIINISAGFASKGITDASQLTEALFSTDFTESYNKLAVAFRDLVANKAKKGEDDRVVVFVDDLDRLSPGRAIELLEVMKNFFDCPKCVFVLAIDYGVVIRGVKEKYGQDFDDEKGKSFFDKIIQVPFRVPLSSYNIQEYVKSNFEHIGVIIEKEDTLKIYVELIENSIGNNPRSMKRLFNSFLLLSNVAGEDIMNDDSKQLLLFALLCMQSQFADVYDYLIKLEVGELNSDTLKALTDSDEVLKKFQMDEEELRCFINFYEYFYDIVNKDKDNIIDDTELEVLKNVLAFSSITNASSNNMQLRNTDTICSTDDVFKNYPSAKKLGSLYMSIVEKTIRELRGDADAVAVPRSDKHIDYYITLNNGKKKLAFAGYMRASGEISIELNATNCEDVRNKYLGNTILPQDFPVRTSGKSMNYRLIDEKQAAELEMIIHDCLASFTEK